MLLSSVQGDSMCCPGCEYISDISSNKVFLSPHGPAASPYLLLRGRAELLGLLGGERGGHVERLHHLVVAELLVGLEAGHEVVGEGHHRLDAVAHLAVTQVLQQAAHLQHRGRRVSINNPGPFRAAVSRG